MEAYLDTIEHQLDVTGEDADRVGLYQRMATTWEEQFQKPDRAIECLNKILALETGNERVYRDLERLCAAERQWDALVENYRQHIEFAADPGERTSLYLSMAQVYEKELQDPDRAIEAYGEVVVANPDDIDALRGLSRLYEETEQWERAVESMQRLSASSAPDEKVDLNFRMGKIYEAHLSMPDTAEERLNEALAFDPKHVPSMLALLNLYQGRGDYMKATALMVKAQEASTNNLERVRLLFEAGQLMENELADPAQAAEMYAKALALDPEHVASATPLARILFEQGSWGQLVPILQVLVRKQDDLPKEELQQLYYRLAKATDQEGDAEGALEHYGRAMELDPTHVPTIMERADLLYRMARWDEALKLYQNMLVHYRDGQKQDQLVEIFHRIGHIKLQQGDTAKATNMFEKALAMDPTHRPTLDALTQVLSTSGDWDAVVRQKRVLLQHSQSTEEKQGLLREIIRVYQEEVKDPQKAITAYLEALELEPKSPHLLHEVLELFTETKQWRKAVEILNRLADLETGKIRAKYLEAAGKITFYELQAADEAIDLFNASLDEDPDNLKTFERIDKILTSKKDWKNQERNYRRMIKRMGAEVPEERRTTQVALWHALGEIYRSRLRDFKAAAQAFEVCASLEPKNLERRKILAELYQVIGGSRVAKAVDTYRFLIANVPDLNDAVPFLRVLRKLFSDTQQYDRAWCVISRFWSCCGRPPMTSAGSSSSTARRICPTFKGGLSEEQWQKHIYHPDQSRYVSHVFATVSMAVAATGAQELKHYGLRRKDRRDVENDPLLFSKVMAFASRFLGVHRPDVYLRQEQPGDMDLANAREKGQLLPSLVVGSSLLQGHSVTELAYVIGKRLTLMRPDHLVRWPQVVPTVAALKSVFLAALRLIEPSLPVDPAYEASVADFAKRLKATVPPQALEQLQVVVQRFLESQAEADLKKWSTAVDFTSSRAGFLLSGDLETTVRMVQAEPAAVGMPEPTEKIRDLIEWCISEDHFALREQLGLAIGRRAARVNHVLGSATGRPWGRRRCWPGCQPPVAG